MGRRRDPNQEAKGFPARRKTAAEKAEARALETAKLLAAAPHDPADVFASPNLLHIVGMAGALAVWRDYAPRLRQLNLLDAADRHTFSLFCVYTAEFHECAAICADPKKKWFTVKLGHGGTVTREHPAVDRMDKAGKMMLELAARFGLTPLDRYDLLGKQSAAIGGQGGGLFGGHQPQQQQPRPDEASPAAPEPASIIGALGGLDAAPPERKH